jgi:putative transposase
VKQESCREEKQIYRAANRIRTQTGGTGHPGGRGLPQGRHQDATFYNWKKKYGGLGPSELRRLRQLEEENTKLKKLVADLSLDKAMLQDVLSKKL